MPEQSGSSSSGPRRYAFSCAACRRKKIRCDGVKPTCRHCLKSKLSCAYSSNSGDALLLQQQLDVANRRILDLEAQIVTLASSRIPGSPLSDHRETVNVNNEHHSKALNEDDSTIAPDTTELSVDEHGKVIKHCKFPHHEYWIWTLAGGIFRSNFTFPRGSGWSTSTHSRPRWRSPRGMVEVNLQAPKTMGAPSICQLGEWGWCRSSTCS